MLLDKDFFAKYDEMVYVSFCPGVKINCLNDSSFDEDYKFEMDWRLWVKNQEDIDFNFQ